MFNPFNLDSTYHAGKYRCGLCVHETIIFIDTRYTMFGFMETDKVCCICKEKKDIVSDGDLILRYDWPDPDNYPWQLQAAKMKDEDRYCKDCRNRVPYDWKKFIIPCSKCDGYMEFDY